MYVQHFQVGTDPKMLMAVRTSRGGCRSSLRPAARKPCLRLHRPKPRRAQKDSVSPGHPATHTPKQIRLQPIVAKSLQPFLLRDGSCKYLECRSTGRRCIYADARPVSLEYQVAYCLGDRHTACSLYRSSSSGGVTLRRRRFLYATMALVMIALVAAAFVQASGTPATSDLGRAVGLS